LVTIFKDLGISIYIDNTRDAIINMLNTSSNLFERNKNKEAILLKDRPNLKTETNMYFNAKIEKEIREIYLQLMENFREPI
jgi:hypothetical protein